MFGPSVILKLNLGPLWRQVLITDCPALLYSSERFFILLYSHLLHLSLFVRLPDLAPHRCSRSTFVTRAVIRRQAWRTAHFFFLPEFFTLRKNLLSSFIINTSAGYGRTIFKIFFLFLMLQFIGWICISYITAVSFISKYFRFSGKII